MKRLSKKILALILLLLFSTITSYAAVTDSVNLTITIPGTVTISEDNVPLSIAGLTPGVVSSDEKNTITVASNSSTGFTVSIELEDINATSGQLCEDNGLASCTSHIFDGDGTSSYISFTSDEGTGNLDSLEGATFTDSETKLGSSTYPVFVGTGVTDPDDFDVHYDVYADETLVPTAYEGNLTFTIVAN